MLRIPGRKCLHDGSMAKKQHDVFFHYATLDNELQSLGERLSRGFEEARLLELRVMRASSLDLTSSTSSTKGG